MFIRRRIYNEMQARSEELNDCLTNSLVENDLLSKANAKLTRENVTMYHQLHKINAPRNEQGKFVKK